MLSRIRQIAVSVADLEASKSFYRDQLGINLIMEYPGLAFFDLDGIWLMVSAATANEPAAPGSVLYFQVDDIDSAFRTLQENGVTFVDKPHRVADMGTYELWMTFFRDPDGTTLALRAEVSK